MASWRWIVFKTDSEGNGINARMVHAWARSAMLEILRAHNKPVHCEIEKEKESTEMFLDTPGMVITTRPTEVFTLLGLKITIPCEDVGVFAERLLGVITDPKRSTHWLKGGAVLHGFHRSLVLTRAQADAFHKMLAARADEAGKKSDAFMKEWERERSVEP